MNRRLFTLGIFFLLLQGRSVFASTTADALVADAWKAWEQNNKQLVEAKFLAAIKEDPRNTRAALGLSLLYILQKKNAASWERLKTVMQPEPDSYPYLYSLWTTAAMRNRYYDLNVDLVPLVEQLSRKADSGGVLKGMAAEVLGGYFERRGDIATSNRYYQQIHEIKDWMLIGPFDNTSASGFDKFYPPELEYEPSKTYEAKNGIPANWFKLATGKNDRWIEFTRYFSNNESVFYANDFVYSPKKQSVQIRIGTSGSLKAFLNDEQIAEFVDETNNDLDNYIVEADLQEGWNRLLIKCGFSEISKCNFLARITDLHGEPIDGLALSTESKPYKCRPGANSRLIPNFAEAFFKTKITAAPGALLRGLLRQKSKKQQEMSFSQLLSQDFPDVKLTKLELGAIDSREPFVECSYDYEVPNYLGEAGQFKVLKIPWAEPFKNDPGLARDNRKFPYYYWPWADTMTEEIEIKLPAGFEPVEPMKDVNITSEVADYSVKLEFANGVIKGSRKLVNKKMVVSPEQYPEFKKFYAAVVKEDQRVILLRGK